MDWDIKQSLLAGFYNGCRAHGSVMSEHVREADQENLLQDIV